MKKGYVLVTCALVLLAGAGCRSPEKRGRHDGLDGGYVMKQECDMPTVDCFNKCSKRGASVTCIGCCRDQEYLCDTGQKYSYESCDDTR